MAVAILIVVWLLLSAYVARVAARSGRNGARWFLASIVCSPALAGILVLALPSPRIRGVGECLAIGLMAFVQLPPLLIVLSFIAWELWGPDEISEPLSAFRSAEQLKQAIDFSPASANLVYSWRHCCKKSQPFGGWPGSTCVIFQLDQSEFEKVSTRRYPRVDWKTSGCWPSPLPEYTWLKENERMKGCSQFDQSRFAPNRLKFALHGETCSSDTGTILKINAEHRLVMVERYFYE